MSTNTKTGTLGQAIDDIVAALEPLEAAVRIIAVKAACEHLNIEQPVKTRPLDARHSLFAERSDSDESKTGDGSHKIDIKTLKNEKLPSSAIEMACIVGYYLQEAAPTDERKQAILWADIDKYFRQAGYPLPKAKGQLLVDAKAAGYFDSSGRGEYKLNAVGYNLVAHSLPRSKKTSK